jgi:hypothetical protein
VHGAHFAFNGGQIFVSKSGVNLNRKQMEMSKIQKLEVWKNVRSFLSEQGVCEKRQHNSKIFFTMTASPLRAYQNVSQFENL